MWFISQFVRKRLTGHRLFDHPNRFVIVVQVASLQTYSMRVMIWNLATMRRYANVRKTAMRIRPVKVQQGTSGRNAGNITELTPPSSDVTTYSTCTPRIVHTKVKLLSGLIFFMCNKTDRCYLEKRWLQNLRIENPSQLLITENENMFFIVIPVT